MRNIDKKTNSMEASQNSKRYMGQENSTRMDTTARASKTLKGIVWKRSRDDIARTCGASWMQSGQERSVVD